MTVADQNVRVIDLLPGDLVANYGMEAVFISREPHPKYKGLALVHWRLMEGDESHDALSYEQVVGDRKPSTDEQRDQRLRAAVGDHRRCVQFGSPCGEDCGVHEVDAAERNL